MMCETKLKSEGLVIEVPDFGVHVTKACLNIQLQCKKKAHRESIKQMMSLIEVMQLLSRDTYFPPIIFQILTALWGKCLRKKMCGGVWGNSIL